MLQKPVVPLCPVTVNATVVVCAVWLVVIVVFDICVVVMLPTMGRMMVAPLFKVA
jgi:hypothetical protein